MRGQHISFCSFCSSCGLRETSIGVDYTERRKTAREKRKNVCFHHYIIITCGSPQREEIFFRKILGGGGFFTNFIKQNYTDFEEEERLREKRKNVCFHH